MIKDGAGEKEGPGFSYVGINGRMTAGMKWNSKRTSIPLAEPPS